MSTNNAARLAVALCAGISLLCAFPIMSRAQATDNANTPEPNDPITTAPDGAPLSPQEQALANSTDEQIATSPTLSNDGIYGCLGQGAQVQNVGTRTALGGVYVPVNDAAVTVNTGFLVYKECILDGVARKIAENGTSEYARQNLNAIATGRNGSPQFVQNEEAELEPQHQIILVNTLKADASALCPAFVGTVQGAIARGYLRAHNQPSSAFSCSMPPEGSSLWSRLAALRDPVNNSFGAYLAWNDSIQRTIAMNDYNQYQRWLRGDGFYDTLDNPSDPLNARIITPGYVVAQSLTQVLGSGFRQLESADEIDQVVGNFFGGLTTQLVSDTRGLIGLTLPVNGQASYLDRMVAQTSANVRQQASNAAVGIIGAARDIETTYRTAKEGIAAALTDAITQLRGAENQCWNLIVPAVEAAAQGSCTTSAFGGTTCSAPVAITVATSTQFSQAVIDAQIAPLATTTINEIRASDSTLSLLNQLLASVTNSASTANQQQALLRLDTMVANRQLHTSTDATNAVQQKDNVVSAVSKLVSDTVTAWGDSTDPNVGWCNVNNPAVIQRWLDAWKT